MLSWSVGMTTLEEVHMTVHEASVLHTGLVKNNIDHSIAMLFGGDEPGAFITFPSEHLELVTFCVERAKRVAGILRRVGEPTRYAPEPTNGETT